MDKELERDIKLLERLPRKDYMKVFKELGKDMFNSTNTVSVGDIADVVNNKYNETFENITNFTGLRDATIALIRKNNSKYSDKESGKFMKEIISSHVTDISDSGYFYKQLMSSCDDIRIIEDDCGSTGKEILVTSIDEETYNFKIRFSFITELDDYAIDFYEDFMEKVKDYMIIHIRTPFTCNHAKDRKLCNKCAGVIKRNNKTFYTPKNIGIFTTLMITEHATQSSLDSMNKGTSQNVNYILDRKTSKNPLTWDEFLEDANQIIDDIGYINVQSRFYEIALISRLYKSKKNDGLFISSSFRTSFMHQDDPLGVFIYRHTYKNFLKLIEIGEFESDSIKSKLMFDIYK
jgi:hypothetical protein